MIGGLNNKMVVQQTSFDAYLHLLRNAKLDANQTIILDVFKIHDPLPLSNTDVSHILNWGINRITPRVLELRLLGKLVHVGYRIDLFSHRRVMTWGLPSTIKEYSKYDILSHDKSWSFPYD